MTRKVLKVPPTFDEGKEQWSKYEEKEEGGHVDRTKPGKVRFSEKGMGSEKSTPAVTLCGLFQAACKKAGKEKALMVERPCPPIVKGEPVPPCLPLNQWKTWTFQQYYDECMSASRAFMTLGLKRFDAVNIFGFNSPEWIMAEFAAIMGGGIAAGIYPTDTPEQVVFKARHSGAAIAVCETMKEAKCFLDNLEKLPVITSVIIWDPADESKFEDKTVGGRVVKVIHWKNLKELAEKTPMADLEKRMAEQEPGNVCAYIYTSGTTGNPKAVMISHDNLVFNTSAVLANIPDMDKKQEDRILSYLPLSHVAGMLLDVISPILTAARKPGWVCTAFARPYDLRLGSVGDRLRAIKPTMFLGVPRVWEKIAEKMQAIGAKTKGAKKKIATWAKAKGLAHQKNMQLGGNGAYPFMYGVAEKAVLSKVLVALGLEKCRFGFTGAAPISTETLEYFGALGIQINECYGMSECTGATTWSSDEAHVWGSCGWALPSTEVKILNTESPGVFKECPRAADLFNPTEAEQGEICFRGRHIMVGYMANPDLGQEHVDEIKKKLKESVDETGWLHSGDKGCMDTRGMVKITGRYKELIIGAGGENIAPVPIENNIKKLMPGISNVMMIGDKRKFNTCVVTLKAKGASGDSPGTGDLDGEALKVNPKVTTIKQAIEYPTWIKAITAAIDATNKDGSCCPSNASAIQKFMILPRDFSVETNELTPTLKLKRSEVDKKHKDELNKMYECKEQYYKYAGPWPGDAAKVVEEPTAELVKEDILEADDADTRASVAAMDEEEAVEKHSKSK